MVFANYRVKSRLQVLRSIRRKHWSPHNQRKEIHGIVFLRDAQNPAQASTASEVPVAGLANHRRRPQIRVNYQQPGVAALRGRRGQGSPLRHVGATL